MFSPPRSDRPVTYAIDVRLDPSTHVLDGKEQLTWRNLTSGPVREMQFHLYLNAFKNSESTFMKESGGQHRGARREDWGWIDVVSITSEDGSELRGNARFIHPDDENEADQTVLLLPLRTPIPPGGRVTLSLVFSARLPKIFARTGFGPGDYHLIGQWFPKPGVFEPPGGRHASPGEWNCHQFHANTEFYSDFAVFDVRMTLPSRFVVGATGIRTSETHNGDGTVTYGYHAEDVHDFAWAASPAFVESISRWRHVALRTLMQPQHLAQASRYIHAATFTLDYLEEHVGPYPYPVLTIVDPAWGALGSGGMEYPTFITAGTLAGMPEGIRFPELVAVHEITHNYFYGMLASNEFEEAWLDEGCTQYFECRIMDAMYGAGSSVIDVLGLHAGDFEVTRAGYTSMRNPRIAPLATPAWKFPRGAYGAMTYEKTAVVLATLEGLLGQATMDSVWREYFRRWSFRHPAERDFLAVVDDVVRRDGDGRYRSGMGWYFDQVIHGTGVCDYEVGSVSSAQMDIRGMFDGDSGKIFTDSLPESSATRSFFSTVVVNRLGEVTLPAELLVRFSDGSETREFWDGGDRVKEFRYARPARAVWACVDPARARSLDVNQTNNVKSSKPSESVVWKYAGKVLFWMQNLLHFVAVMI
jgi:hypothetical protein